VERLSQGDVLDLKQLDADAADAVTEAPPETPAEKVTVALESLPSKYDTERIERPVSWYFSLGEVKYSVVVTETGCEVTPGRPQAGSADCVIKAEPEMIRRLICDSYIPTPAEFVSGVIKTNDIPLLIEFSRVFGLTDYQS
jgi:long-chain acyl-CoA synthetase